MKHTKKNRGALFLLGVFTLQSGLFFSVRAEENQAVMALADALETALTRNPTANAARAMQEAAQARVSEARSSSFPQIALSAGYTRYEEPNIIVPIHRAGVFPPLDNDIYESAVQLRAPLFDGGRTRAAHRAAKAVADAYQAQEDLARIGLIEGVTRIFIQSLALEDTRRLLATRLGALKQRHDELALLLAEGRVSPGDLALVASAIEQIRSDSIEAASGQAELAILLGQMTGADGPVRPLCDGLARSVPEKFMPGIRPRSSEDVFAPTIGPDVRRTQAQLKQAKALKAQATGTFWPEVAGFASYSLRSGGDFEHTGEWAVGVTVRVPLFDGGGRIAKVRAAQASAKAAEEQSRAAWQEQRAQVLIALDQRRSSRDRRNHLGQAAQAKWQSVTAQQKLYREGRITLSELLTQEGELLQLQIRERGSALGEMIAMLQYHAVTGTLTVDQVNALLGSSQ